MVAIDAGANDIDEMISAVEHRNELRTVLWRFPALLVFAVSVALEPDVVSHGIHVALVFAYAVTSLLAVLLVFLGWFRPWMNWLYVGVDAALVVYLLAEHMFIPGASFTEALATPSLAISFVLLSHASMRMRAGPVAAFAVLVTIGSVSAATLSLFHDSFRMGVTAGELQAASVRLLAFAAVAAIQVMLVVDIKRLVRSSVSSSSARTNLARFFSPVTAELLATEGAQIGLRRHEAAVLFIDIRGFTGLSETMELEDVASLLSEYRHRVVETVAEWDGTVDKFMGDGVMAVFGFPNPDASDGSRAFDCACQLVHRLEAWSEVRTRQGENPLGFGVGIHFGQVIGGVVAGGRHSEYTVLGDAVNLADRFQGMCKALDARIVMSSEIAAKQVRGKVDREWRAARDVPVPGRAETADVFYLPNTQSVPAKSPPQQRPELLWQR